MEMLRNRTKEIRIGNVWIGGSHPVAIQSMTNTKTEDVAATVEQILALEEAGCEIIRCAVPTMEAALALKEIKKQIHIPLVADIHFDYRLAIAAIENGADKIRINPGNIGSKERVQAVVEKAKEYNVPIRVGVNSGSLEKNHLAPDFPTGEEKRICIVSGLYGDELQGQYICYEVIRRIKLDSFLSTFYMTVKFLLPCMIPGHQCCFRFLHGDQQRVIKAVIVEL